MQHCRAFTARACRAHSASSLCAAGNSIGVEGGKKLAAELDGNTALTKLNLGGACSEPSYSAAPLRAYVRAGGRVMRWLSAHGQARSAPTSPARRVPQVTSSIQHLERPSSRWSTRKGTTRKGHPTRWAMPPLPVEPYHSFLAVAWHVLSLCCRCPHPLPFPLLTVSFNFEQVASIAAAAPVAATPVNATSVAAATVTAAAVAAASVAATPVAAAPVAAHIAAAPVVNGYGLIACVERGDKAGVEAAEADFSELSPNEQKRLVTCTQSATGRLLALGLLGKYAPDAHALLFVKLLGHETMGVREVALQALAKVSATCLAEFAGDFLKITKRKPQRGRKPIALVGYKALQLLSPEALEKAVRQLGITWPELQLEAERTLKKLPSSTLDRLRQELPNLRAVLAPEPATQGAPADLGGTASIQGSNLAASTAGTVFKVTLTQHDAAAEETWTCECSSVDDGTVNDFIEHFATFPDEATLREQLIERFTLVHSGRELVCTGFPWDGEALEFQFEAKLKKTAASPVPPAPPAPPMLPVPPAPPVSTKPDDIIFPQQWLIALELAERIRRIYRLPWSELYARFRKVDFAMFTANFCTVADQTLKRVEARGSCTSTSDDGAARRVLRYADAKDMKINFASLQKRATGNPKTLFLVFADECHWGALKNGPHDHYVTHQTFEPRSRPCTRL